MQTRTMPQLNQTSWLTGTNKTISIRRARGNNDAMHTREKFSYHLPVAHAFLVWWCHIKLKVYLQFRRGKFGRGQRDDNECKFWHLIRYYHWYQKGFQADSRRVRRRSEDSKVSHPSIKTEISGTQGKLTLIEGIIISLGAHLPYRRNIIGNCKCKHLPNPIYHTRRGRVWQTLPKIMWTKNNKK